MRIGTVSVSVWTGELLFRACLVRFLLAAEPLSLQAGALPGVLCRTSDLVLRFQEALLEGVVLVVHQVLDLADDLDDLLHGVVDEESHRRC